MSIHYGDTHPISCLPELCRAAGAATQMYMETAQTHLPRYPNIRSYAGTHGHCSSAGRVRLTGKLSASPELEASWVVSSHISGRTMGAKTETSINNTKHGETLGEPDTAEYVAEVVK